MNRAQAILLVLLLPAQVFAAFFNFETAPVHPVALNSNGTLLAVCNLPDGKVETFTFADTALVPKESIPVGIDPVTVRFRSDTELWVVNALSDSINIIDVEKSCVVRVISTRTRPADVVFAGSPQRAFVSCPADNVIQVLDPETSALIQTLKIEAERPKALCVSPDGSKVYAAILESGNGTTILAPRLTDLGHAPGAGPLDLPLGPYGGLNPPPNKGTNLYPVLSTNLPASNAPPRVGLIVKKQADGRWLDDNNGDWTDMVSRANAPFTGRVPGWDLLDRDVAVIDANTLSVDFINRLMNICMDVAANPGTGQLAVIGTDAINHVRYEPVLKSIFVRAQLSLVDSGTIIADLNPHLDYSVTRLPPEERRETLGDPRGVVWNRDGSRLYVSGMGSDNVAMFDTSGKRVAVSGLLPPGPTGLVFDSHRNRLYVLSRFAASVSSLDAETLAIQQTITFFDPTPEAIRKGRSHFYNTQKTSGLGQAACASCHVDGRFDRLAWDLGTPTGELKEITTNLFNFTASEPTPESPFHPMKGPMVTQTLQDIIGHEPFHWRGDRAGIEEFNPTFTDLQGADAELTDAEMQEFEDFLATIRFPPNRLRNFDNSLPTNLPLPNHPALGRGNRLKGEPLPNGNAVVGMNFFGANVLACTQCHSMPTGNGPDRVFRNGRWATIPPGPKGERHLGVTAVPRSDFLPFKIAHLRNLSEKTGFSLSGPSQAGFGFFHDGRTDSLTRFLQDGFGMTDDKQTADLLAFLLAFSGSDLPNNLASNSDRAVPGTLSLDAPAATGLQLLLTANSSELDRFISRATVSTGRVDLIVTSRVASKSRGWLYLPGSRVFKPDSLNATPLSRTELFALNREAPLLFTLVPKETGERLALDRNSNGILNSDEMTDVMILSSTILNKSLVMTWSGAENRRYNILRKAELGSIWEVLEERTTTGPVTTNSIAIGPGAQSFFRVEVLAP